ncbi:MAG: hypothetical protein IT319_22730 [Anaerolineae bacterium]|nr:hypothetical protein [Anaerolineae bacterium]
MSSQDEISQQVQRASEVQARYSDELMRKPNVVGVAVGYASQGGARTPEIGIVVMVDRKIPLNQLAPQDVIPTELDGVRVDVQETGAFSAQ